MKNVKYLRINLIDIPIFQRISRFYDVQRLDACNQSTKTAKHLPRHDQATCSLLDQYIS